VENPVLKQLIESDTPIRVRDLKRILKLPNDKFEMYTYRAMRNGEVIVTPKGLQTANGVDEARRKTG
jgi:hypothetical protein